MVDVVEEQVQGGDALDQAGLDVFPLAGGDHPWERIEREDALGAFLVAVDRERDALLKEEQLEAAELLAEFLVAEAGEFFGHVPVIRTDYAVLIDEFVEEVGPFVV
jgi:hypothetical protein